MKKSSHFPWLPVLLARPSLGWRRETKRTLPHQTNKPRIPVTGKYEEKTAEAVYSVDIAWGSWPLPMLLQPGDLGS